MVLRKIDTAPDRLWLGRGVQGQTVQAVAVARNGQGATVTVRRVGSATVTVDLDSTEVAALHDWLGPVPDSKEEA